MITSISDRQLEIIETSGKIMLEHGLKGLTTKTLAKEIGFSESAIYRHFKSKEDIILSLLSYLKENIIERLEPIKNSDISPIQKIQEIFENQYDFFYEREHFVVAIMSEDLLDETSKIREVFISILQYKKNLIETILKEHFTSEENSELRIDNFANTLLAIFRFSLLQWKIIDFQDDIKTKGAFQIQNYLKLITNEK